ncbi:unnamed protein product, partial [marine sediment metagenome]
AKIPRPKTQRESPLAARLINPLNPSHKNTAKIPKKEISPKIPVVANLSKISEAPEENLTPQKTV